MLGGRESSYSSTIKNKAKLVLMPKVLNKTIGQHKDCSQRVVRLRQYDIKLATKPN